MLLQPTNLEVFLEKQDKGSFLGTYFEYDLDFDIKPYIKEPIEKEILAFNTQEFTLCKQFYDYNESRYSYMFNEGHTLQSLFESNKIVFDDSVKYYLYKYKK